MKNGRKNKGFVAIPHRRGNGYERLPLGGYWRWIGTGKL
jgi:hypothetical protein